MAEYLSGVQSAAECLIGVYSGEKYLSIVYIGAEYRRGGQIGAYYLSGVQSAEFLRGVQTLQRVSEYVHRGTLKSKEPPQTFVPKILLSLYLEWANCKGFLKPKSIH